ncbi:MAG: hypothetical protein CL678_12535 [Bdellovibrionaceae bacterium]|nr:hypothetical protein [Pseudobdellovibrionaceae bacterium]|tara:strand:- start:1214 stop:3055 length:1842 start_codon:yes stop_codon:yes gene_type:complete
MATAAKTSNDDWTIQDLALHISEVIGKESGNVLGENQQSMVLSRLKKRMIDLGNLTPSEYYQHLQNHYKDETSHLVSLLTTHHTFFFREFLHFEFILNNLEEIIQRVKSRGDNKIRIYSAACSRGHEVYSLATFMEYHLKDYPEISYEIFGSDIDPESVKIAKNGVYLYSEVKSIPQIYVSGNWQRGVGEISNYAKVKSHIKEKCEFGVVNLLDLNSVLSGKKFDLIFCRNVFIYFDNETIFKIVSSFKNYLYKNGVLVTGISESLKTIDIKKKSLAPSVYAFDFEENVPDLKIVKDETAPVEVVKPHKPIIPKPIRMLVVDDSASVVKLLGKMFSSDPDFELVGTAENGKEAEEFLKKNHVDAMTLDIHMPEMDGVEYLKKNYKNGHPHVVVVSSASREDTRYAQKTLEYGATDFVEKPALNNFKERSEEIKNKIKMAFFNNSSKEKSIDKSFEKDYLIENCETKARVFFASVGDSKKIKETLDSFKGTQPPLFIFYEGNSNQLEMISGNLNTKQKVMPFSEDQAIENNLVYVCDFNQHFPFLKDLLSKRKVSFSVFGICSEKVEKEIIEFDEKQLLLEDISEINQSLKEIATDIFPWTSFSHVGTEYLSKE